MAKHPKRNARSPVKLTRGVSSGRNSAKRRCLRAPRPCEAPNCKRQHRRRLGAKYCSPACAKRAYRARRVTPDKCASPTLFPARCLNPRCGAEMWARAGQRFCSDSCRVQAHRRKVEATIAALVELYRMPYPAAEDLYDVYGMRSLGNILTATRRYDPALCAWV